MKAGSGPRHLTFSPNGNYAYLINELSGTVIAFEYKDGDLKEIQTIVADTACEKAVVIFISVRTANSCMPVIA